MLIAEGQDPYPGDLNSQISETLCIIIFAGLSKLQVRAKIIVQNYRMDLPRGTPPAIVRLVTQCWDKEPSKRPDFSQIVRQLKELASSNAKTQRETGTIFKTVREL